MSPIQASLKKNEEYVYNNLTDQRKKKKRKFQINDLVRTAVFKKTFSKRDTAIWSYKLYKITEKTDDSIPNYKINKLKGRYNESLLKKSELTLKRTKM